MKKLLLIFCLAGLSLLAACHRNDDKASEHKQKIKHSKEAVQFESTAHFDLTQFDTANYYMGEIGDQTYLFKIDKARPEKLTGRYYDAKAFPVAQVHKFEFKHNGNEYLFCANKKETPVKFSIIIDTASITGSFSTDPLELEKKQIAFEKYRAPKYQKAESPRYALDCPSNYLPVSVHTDVIYGHAKGHWTSLEVDNEKVFKTIMKGIGQASTSKNLDLTMDLYIPQEDSITKRPLLVLLHGGALYIGDKGAETMSTWCRHFAQVGYVVASINYRMGFTLSKSSIQKCGYQAMQDLHAAVRFLVAHAEDYGIDPDHIFLGGTSAGSITMMNTIFMDKHNRLDFIRENKLEQKLGRLESSGNKHTNSFKVCAVANMWGALYDLDMLNTHHIPVISFHGTDDDIVPYDEGFPFSSLKGNLGERLFDKMYGSKPIHERLDSLHVRNEFYPIEGAKHAPYQDAGGHPNSQYFFIQEKMQQFFYTELKQMRGIRQDAKEPQCYYIEQPGAKSVCWSAKGGFILSQDESGCVILWRSDARQRQVRASGYLANGVAFEVSM